MSTAPARVAPPRRPPAASLTGSILAIALIALAVVTVRDLAVAQGWSAGSTWTGAVVDRLDGQTADVAVLVTGVVLALVGLLLVIVAVKPRRRSHLATSLSGDVWVTRSALSAVAVGAAEDTPGVVEASATVRRSTVAVTVRARSTDIQPAVETNVRRRLQGFTDRTVAVSIQKVNDDA